MASLCSFSLHCLFLHSSKHLRCISPFGPPNSSIAFSLDFFCSSSGIKHQFFQILICSLKVGSKWISSIQVSALHPCTASFISAPIILLQYPAFSISSLDNGGEYRTLDSYLVTYPALVFMAPSPLRHHRSSVVSPSSQNRTRRPILHICPQAPARFNSRTPAGCDMILMMSFLFFWLFQLTHPCGVRHSWLILQSIVMFG